MRNIEFVLKSAFLRRRKSALAAVLSVAFLAGVAPTPVYAAYPQTDADFAQLPPYCKWKMKGDRDAPARRKWARKLKGGFIHIHHYCAAMHSMRLASAPSIKQADRIYLLKSAKGDLLYMVDKAAPDFVLRQEIALRLQSVMAQLNAAKIKRKTRKRF